MEDQSNVDDGWRAQGVKNIVLVTAVTSIGPEPCLYVIIIMTYNVCVSYVDLANTLVQCLQITERRVE